jgi:EF hand
LAVTFSTHKQVMASNTLLLFRRSGQLALAAGLTVSATHRHTPPCYAEAAPEAPSLKESIVGSYEDRVRNFSSPSRVFEFFASVSRPQGTFMTPEDFARAVTPYQRKPGQELGSRNFKYNFQARHRAPSAEQRAAYSALLQAVLADRRVTAEECTQLVTARQELNIDPEAHLAALAQLGMTNAELEQLVDEVQQQQEGGVPQRRSSKLSFFALVDLDGDGLISWEEFALFQTLLAIPRHKLSLAFGMFDEDRSGTVDYEEFERFMQVLLQMMLTSCTVAV